MIIYLEGVDGSGKTTLAKTIQKICKNLKIPCDIQAERFICTKPNSENRVKSEELIELFKRMQEERSKVYVLDRGPISDIVYRIFDDYNPVIDLDTFIDLIDEDLQASTMLIYCKNENAYNNMITRGDDNQVAITKHKEISKVYNLVMDILYPRLSCSYIKYDYNSYDAQDKITSIKDFIKRGYRKRL